MKTLQPELDFSAARKSGSGPVVDAAEVAALINWLRGKGWQTSSQIAAALGLEERRLRALAEHSDGEILSGPGCPGYCIFDATTSLGDADRAAGRLESQASKMLERAKTIRRRLYRCGRAV